MMASSLICDCVKVFFSTKWFRLMLFQFNQIMLRSFEVKVFLMPFCVPLKLLKLYSLKFVL